MSKSPLQRALKIIEPMQESAFYHPACRAISADKDPEKRAKRIMENYRVMQAVSASLGAA